MKPLTKAIAVALIQALIVCSLGAKLLYDRRSRPQAWFRTQRYDPNLPIRGRYLGLQVEVNDPRSPEELQKKFGNEMQAGFLNSFGQECGSIVLRGDKPSAEFDSSPAWDCDNLTFIRSRAVQAPVRHEGDVGFVDNDIRLRLSQSILFFLADTAKDPTSLPRGDELWVLATIPRKGPPRPIALGVKKAGETEIHRLDLN